MNVCDEDTRRWSDRRANPVHEAVERRVIADHCFSGGRDVKATRLHELVVIIVATPCGEQGAAGVEKDGDGGSGLKAEEGYWSRKKAGAVHLR